MTAAVLEPACERKNQILWSNPQPHLLSILGVITSTQTCWKFQKLQKKRRESLYLSIKTSLQRERGRLLCSNVCRNQLVKRGSLSQWSKNRHANLVRTIRGWFLGLFLNFHHAARQLWLSTAVLQRSRRWVRGWGLEVIGRNRTENHKRQVVRVTEFQQRVPRVERFC